MTFKFFLLSFVLCFVFQPFPIHAQSNSGGYPRIYNLWGNNNNGADNAYFSGFSLYAMYGNGSNQASKDRADAIHALNPNTKILITADIIPAHPAGSGLDTQPQWWNAARGTPDYACILRDSAGNILRDVTYNAAYNNLASSYCRDVLVNYFISRWNSSGGHFDGWQVDQAGDSGVTWSIGTNIDINGDGVADDPAAVDAAYVSGMIDIFTRLRAAFPNIIINGNDSPPYYGAWINGRLYEMDLKRYLDKESTKPWPEIIQNWSAWTANRTHQPNTTMIMNSPNSQSITSKFNFQNIWTSIKPAMLAEYSADYDRMRFGLASALMADAIYTYDLSGYMYGLNWWYDEYGTRGNVSTLGYLGLPTSSPAYVSQLNSPDQVVNGNFSAGTTPWFTAVSGPIVANYSVENGEAHIHLSGASSGWALFRENYVTVEAGKYYTLSFRAKSSSARLGGVRIQRAGGAWEYLTEAKQVSFYPDWTQYRLPIKATGTGTNGSLMFDLGIAAGDYYLDDIKFQEGIGGIWQRNFDRGAVLLNESPVTQTISLDKTYQKLAGTQAPLYSQRLDNNQAVAVGNWATPGASFDQWGSTVHTITSPDNNASLTYNFTIPYSGEYEVLSWVVPAANYSPNVTVSINGTEVNLDETIGNLGWHSLGKFNFNQSAAVVVKPEGTGLVIGDAFKIVSTKRYNDGSTVNSVTLQPDDAIILLNSSRVVLPGDANSDGKIDGIDYIIWLNHYGQNLSGFQNADFNSDQKVDGIDYILWLNNYERG